MNSLVISSYADLRAVEGQELGPGTWSQISEEQCRRFDLICRSGRFDADECGGSTSTSVITAPNVDGAVLLALLGKFRRTIDVVFDYPSRMNLFYGFDNVRFVHLVPVAAVVRLHLRVVEAKMLEPSTIHVVYGHRLELDDGRTALVADVINRVYLK